MKTKFLPLLFLLFSLVNALPAYAVVATRHQQTTPQQQTTHRGFFQRLRDAQQLRHQIRRATKSQKPTAEGILSDRRFLIGAAILLIGILLGLILSWIGWLATIVGLGIMIWALLQYI
jgi:hypothetical protein